MKTVKKKKEKQLFIILPLILIIVFAMALTKKLIYLAADPEKEKDCPPLIPDDAKTAMGTFTMPMSQRSLPFVQRGGTINDASCLDRTAISGIIKIRSEDDIKHALQYAKENKLKV